ncbi:MAG TPA: hypothetical protein VFQ65_06300, partial [Kofleriaceae bacterium]|nr:hypothetical protein [Kofleriaceae bacterium]
MGEDMQAHAIAARTEPPLEPGDLVTDPVTELIIAGHHREAIAACARTYHKVLGRLAMALVGSQADADEVVQETLL